MRKHSKVQSEPLLPTKVKPTKSSNLDSSEGKIDEGTSSFSASVFNLTNNVAGAGMLILSSSKASGATGWVPSICICCALALASACTFNMIGRSCQISGERTFKGLWSQAFSSETAHIVDIVIFLNCFLGSTLYIGLLGDIFSALLRQTMLPDFITSRMGMICFIVVTVLFPLSLIRKLSALSFTSILGVGAVLYTSTSMVVRAFDGSYNVDPSKPIGKFISDNTTIIKQPYFEGSTMWNFDLHSLALVSNFSLAFIAHYNAPSYYHEMKRQSPHSFSRMVTTAYIILAGIYATTMSAGYATFGDACEGNILLNYHPNDTLALLARLATGLSVTFGFPLVSNGAREGLKNATAAYGYYAISKKKNNVYLVLMIIVASSLLAVVVEDIKVIAGFSGAFLGSFLVYICPAILYFRIVLKCFGKGNKEYISALLLLLFVPFGIFTAIMGSVTTYQNMVLVNAHIK